MRHTIIIFSFYGNCLRFFDCYVVVAAAWHMNRNEIVWQRNRLLYLFYKLYRCRYSVSVLLWIQCKHEVRERDRSYASPAIAKWPQNIELLLPATAECEKIILPIRSVLFLHVFPSSEFDYYFSSSFSLHNHFNINFSQFFTRILNRTGIIFVHRWAQRYVPLLNESIVEVKIHKINTHIEPFSTFIFR